MQVHRVKGIARPHLLVELAGSCKIAWGALPLRIAPVQAFPARRFRRLRPPGVPDQLATRCTAHADAIVLLAWQATQRPAGGLPLHIGRLEPRAIRRHSSRSAWAQILRPEPEGASAVVRVGVLGESRGSPHPSVMGLVPSFRCCVACPTDTDGQQSRRGCASRGLWAGDAPV